jgi:hypothetical protein
VAAVSVANLAGNARRVRPVVPGTPPATCDVARQESRFAPVRSALGALNLKGPLGYIGDIPAGRMGADGPATEDYYLAQYWLAPLVLDPGPGACEWAVASLRATAPAGRIPAGWRIEATPGEGVYLLRRAAP